MAIAAHECGHIIQEQQASLGLRFRSAVVPILVDTSRSFPIVFLVMLFVAIFLPALTWHMVALIALLAQLLIIALALLIMPIEKDSSRRGLDWLRGSDLINQDHLSELEITMEWAARTYLMNALSAILNLIDYFGVMRGGRA